MIFSILSYIFQNSNNEYILPIVLGLGLVLYILIYSLGVYYVPQNKHFNMARPHITKLFCADLVVSLIIWFRRKKNTINIKIKESATTNYGSKPVKTTDKTIEQQISNPDSGIINLEGFMKPEVKSDVVQEEKRSTSTKKVSIKEKEIECEGGICPIEPTNTKEINRRVERDEGNSFNSGERSGLLTKNKNEKERNSIVDSVDVELDPYDPAEE